MPRENGFEELKINYVSKHCQFLDVFAFPVLVFSSLRNVEGGNQHRKQHAQRK